MAPCKKCKLTTSRMKKGVNCANCGEIYHVACGLITDGQLKDIESGAIDWRCPECRSKRKSLINVGSERRYSTSSDVETNTISANISQLQADMQSLRTMQQQVLSQMESVTNTVTKIEALNVKVDGNEKRIEVLEKDNKTLRNIVKSLSLRMDNSEQRSCANKLQINNVPVEINDEGLNAAVIDVAKKIDVKLVESDIIDITLVKSRIQTGLNPQHQHGTNDSSNIDDVNINTGSVNVDGPTNDKRPNSTGNTIIVNLKSNNIKKLFLLKSRLNRNRVYFDNEKKHKLYINEFLSSSRRRLFVNAKLFCKENKFDFCWVKNGNIFIRKREGAKAIRIDANTDFAKIGRMDVD